MKTYIGIDNGVTGSIGIINQDGASMFPTPCYQVQDYTKKKQTISRLHRPEFLSILDENAAGYGSKFVILEHPFWNPMLSPKASKSGVMCLEAQLGIIEHRLLPYEVIPSSKWQKEMLPSGCKGKAELKKASMDVGIRLFPLLEDEIRKQKDADGILIAEWARRNNL